VHGPIWSIQRASFLTPWRCVTLRLHETKRHRLGPRDRARPRRGRGRQRPRRQVRRGSARGDRPRISGETRSSTDAYHSTFASTREDQAYLSSNRVATSSLLPIGTFPAEKTQLFCDFPNIPPGPFQPRGGALALPSISRPGRTERSSTVRSESPHSTTDPSQADALPKAGSIRS